MLIYLVIDLSLLRGSSREENLAKLVASVTRTVLCHAGDDAMQFGFSLTDSHVGGYMLSYQLNMVAQGMGIPKNVATTSACDLTRDDLINFLTLVKLVTDTNVVAELNLRASRNSRSSDIPAVETCRVLHTVLKTTCVHKLQASVAGSSSSLSGGSREVSRCGCMLIMTPSLGSKDVLHGYVGKEALEACGGDVGQAFLRHLPLSLWKAVGSHRLSCAWISGNAAEDAEMLSGIEKEVRAVFPGFSLTSLEVGSAGGVTKEAFGECMGFQGVVRQAGQEANSKGDGDRSSCVDVAGIWEETTPHSTIELLQVAMAKMMPRAANMTPLGRKTRRSSGRFANSGNIKQSVLSKAVGGASKRGRRGAAAGGVTGGALQSRRGQKAIRRARMAEQPRGTGALEKSGNETPTSTVDQNANANVPGNVADAMAKGLVPYVENLKPCTMEEAGIRIRAAVARIEAQVLERTASADKDASISAGADAVPLLTATIQKAMAEVSKHTLDQGAVFDAAACRKAFVDMACTPVKELQQQHRTTPFAQLQVLAWTCAIQLLLRLCIGTMSCSWAGDQCVHDGALSSTISLSPDGFAAVENIMHIIVATMSPIPSQGHTLFLSVIKPCFMGRMKDDIKRLEKSIWDEEEMVVDGDGVLADVRIAAESLEESGETPDMSMDGSEDENDRKKPVVSKKVKAMKTSKHASASAGTAQPAMSADGSGIHGGGNYGGTAASGRRGELSTSNLLSRRFNNSKQYKMVVRANPGKSKMAPAAKASTANPITIAKEPSKAIPKIIKASRPTRSAQTSGLDASNSMPSKSHHRQVPDTPLGKAPGQTMPDELAHQDAGGGSGGVITTPDTAMMKRADDVIPNTSPREQPAAKAQMKRIGSIRQPMFDDTATEAIFKASANDDGPAKNTWLSGAIVKRRKPAPSGATRMGDMQNVDSITLARKETEPDFQREIMSPLKPRPRATATVEPDLGSMRTASVEEDVDDIEILLSPGPFVPGRDDEDYTDDGARGESNHEGMRDGQGAHDQGASAANDDCSDGQLDERDDDQRDGNSGKNENNDSNGNNGDREGKFCNDNEAGDEGDVQVEDGGRCETFDTFDTFDAAMSDDEDSMAAKNDHQASECSSSHLHAREDGEDMTSPGGPGKSDGAKPAAMKSPFACLTPEKPRFNANGNAGEAEEVAPESTPVELGSAGTKPKRRTVRGGRLARMHGKTSYRVDPSTTPTSQVHQQRSKTPTRSPIAIEDRGSPCKPSPGYGSFSSPPRQPESSGAVDYASDTDSCMGDTPDVMVAMKPLMQASPDKCDSDEEDAAILNAAANGGLSPVDSDKPAPVPRRIRKKALAAVTTRGPGEVARRNKSKAAAVVTAVAATTRVTAQASQTQKRLTAPLGKMKRTACKSVDAIVAGVKGAHGLDDQENHQAGGDHAKLPANQAASLNPKKGKMTRMPEQGDVVVCFVKTMDAFVRSTIVKEGDVALARRGKGWCLTADVVPVGADAANINAGPFTVKLDSTKEISPEDSISNDATWYRVDPSLPSGPAIVHKAARATKEHKKSTTTIRDKICRKRSPVLREIDNIVTGVGGPKRRKLQPTNLRYEGKALASAERILSQRTPEGLPVSRVDGFRDFDATQGDHILGVTPRTSSLNTEAKSVIARAKALLADPRFS